MTADEARPAGAVRRGLWLPMIVSGLIIAGAVPLYDGLSAWTAAPSAGIFVRYAGPLTRTYFPPPTSWFVFDNAPFGLSFYYLGWYWAVALAAGYLLTVLWYRRQARRFASPPWPRGFLVSAVLLIALAIALPLLTQAVPSLSWLWQRGPWVKGIPALLIIGVALGVVARVQRSRRLALLAVLYAVAALLTGWLLATTPAQTLFWWPGPFVGGWPSILTPLVGLLLPAAVLVAAGLAAFAAQRSATPS